MQPFFSFPPARHGSNRRTSSKVIIQAKFFASYIKAYYTITKINNSSCANFPFIFWRTAPTQIKVTWDFMRSTSLWTKIELMSIPQSPCHRLYCYFLHIKTTKMKDKAIQDFQISLLSPLAAKPHFDDPESNFSTKYDCILAHEMKLNKQIDIST